MSYIVFDKLPNTFKQELVRKIGNNYPKLKDIFDNYADIIHMLNLRQYKNNERPFLDKSKDHSNLENKVSKPIFENSILRAASVNSAKNASKTDIPKNCKFCTCSGHTMLNCKKYPSYQTRKARCIELKICAKCTGQKHSESDCPKTLDFQCKFCNAYDHISALCSTYAPNKLMTNFCVNASHNSGKTFLLPTLSVDIGCGNNKTRVKCLIDTGSQRSYVSNSVIDRLNLPENSNKTNISIYTIMNL